MVCGVSRFSISEFYKSKLGIVLVENTIGYKIVLPEENFDQQLNKFSFLRKNTEIKRGISLDLRFEGQIIELTEEPKWVQHW